MRDAVDLFQRFQQEALRLAEVADLLSRGVFEVEIVHAKNVDHLVGRERERLGPQHLLYLNSVVAVDGEIECLHGVPEPEPIRRILEAPHEHVFRRDAQTQRDGIAEEGDAAGLRRLHRRFVIAVPEAPAIHRELRRVAIGAVLPHQHRIR